MPCQGCPRLSKLEKAPRARWYVVCARARVASGDLFGAEELLLGFLQSNDDPDAQAEYASVLELQYLSEVESEGASASAVPQPPPSSEGRDKLASSFDAWQAVLRLAPFKTDADDVLSFCCSTVLVLVFQPIAGL